MGQYYFIDICPAFDEFIERVDAFGAFFPHFCLRIPACEKK